MAIAKVETFDLKLPLTYSEDLERPGPSTEPKSLVLEARQRSENQVRSWDFLVATQDVPYWTRLLSLYEAGAYGNLPLGITLPGDVSETLVLLDAPEGLDTVESSPMGHGFRFTLTEVL